MSWQDQCMDDLLYHFEILHKKLEMSDASGASLRLRQVDDHQDLNDQLRDVEYQFVTEKIANDKLDEKDFQNDTKKTLKDLVDKFQNLIRSQAEQKQNLIDWHSSLQLEKNQYLFDWTNQKTLASKHEKKLKYYAQIVK